MAEWLFGAFLGRLVLTAVVWVVVALIMTDESNQPTTRSGKVSVRTVVKRLFAHNSVLVWIMFLPFGWFWLEMPGEIKGCWDHPTQTDWTYILDNVNVFAAAYAGAFGAFIVLGVSSTGLIDFLNRNDSTYQLWRQRGGQPFIDNLPSFLNPDPDEIREAVPPIAPPTTCCPNCQGELTLANGCQCGNCGVYWDGYQWLVPS